MTSFLGALGGRLAERWMAFLAMPGLAFVCALDIAVMLGQRNWNELGRLRARLDELAAAPAHSPGTAAVAATGVLAGATTVGAAVQAVGTWYGRPDSPRRAGPICRLLAGRLTARRLRR
ncbi:hypothetical protein AB0C52_24410 [Streptomyces sp. NPDC048717]|uniref:hypothetical protein n=1 Tax=Streptomyces sp. NPDC048717 TaxID=3154928 RepID=UPI00341278D1